MTEEPRTSFTITNLDPRAVRAFDAWAEGHGFHARNAAFTYITRAMANNRIAVMDKLTKALLVGEAEENLLVQARWAARNEARMVLWEEGFISDPAEESEKAGREKP